LDAFNRALRSQIEVEDAFFGESFVGYVPEEFGLKGKTAEEQFVVLARSWDYSRRDFRLEFSANRRAVYLNCLFWVQSDFAIHSIAAELKSGALAGVTEAWKYSRITPALPVAFSKAVGA
jgi:hypothetical protein